MSSLFDFDPYVGGIVRDHRTLPLCSVEVHVTRSGLDERVGVASDLADHRTDRACECGPLALERRLDDVGPVDTPRGEVLLCAFTYLVSRAIDRDPEIDIDRRFNSQSITAATPSDRDRFCCHLLGDWFLLVRGELVFDTDPRPHSVLQRVVLRTGGVPPFARRRVCPVDTAPIPERHAVPPARFAVDEGFWSASRLEQVACASGVRLFADDADETHVGTNCPNRHCRKRPLRVNTSTTPQDIVLNSDGEVTWNSVDV